MTNYPGRDHGSVDKEWLVHKNMPGWWYITGTINDSTGKLYTYQFTIIRAKVNFVYGFMLHLAITDIENEQHYFFPQINFSTIGVTVNDSIVNYKDYATLIKRDDAMFLICNTRDFDINLRLKYGKDPVWHCENGYQLIDTIKGFEESTIYYSYTNMPTSGKIILNGKELEVTGKSWFDRQSGPYEMFERRNNWEWFSLRFFDNEEAMLFTFPGRNHQDGTFIPIDGQYKRLKDFTIIATDTVQVNSFKYTSGWELTMPGIKDEKYTISPIMHGQMNSFYLEELANIIDENGNKVGICIVELMPGVINEKFKIKMLKNILLNK